MVIDLYDNQKGIVFQAPTEVFVGVKQLDDTEAEAFPVDVLNVAEELIGTANNKEEYLQVWNRDRKNAIVGRLTGWVGPFEYVLLVNYRQPAPEKVLIDGTGELLDENGDPILDENGDTIFY